MNKKRVFFSIIFSFIVIISTINLIFLLEISKDQYLRDFFYFSHDLPVIYSNLEVIHMKEVKSLALSSISINLILIGILVYFRKNISLKLSGYTILLIIFLTFTSYLVSFNSFFTNFHKIFFRGENWLLPSNSILIQTYHETYFKEIILVILSILVLFSLILIFYKPKNLKT